MKKIISFISILICAFAVISCSDDTFENPYAKVSTISIESSDVFFQASPGQGSITCNAPNGITRVETTAGWCSATASGTTVTVNVDQNAEKASRVCRVKIYSGEECIEITVQQMGLIFQVEGLSGDIITDDDANVFEYTYRANSEVSLSTEGDFFTAKLEDGKLKVDITENTTGRVRTGFINYVVGGQPGVIKVQQFEYEKEVLGDYTFYYGTNGASTVDVKLQKNDGKYYVVFEQGAIPVSISSEVLENANMKFTNLDFVGDWQTSSVTTDQAIVLLMYTNGSSVYRTSNTTTVSLDGTSSFDESTGAVTWNLVGTAPSGYTFYALRVANTTAGTYATITSTNITAFNYPSKLVKK